MTATKIVRCWFHNSTRGFAASSNNYYSGIPLNGHPSTADTCDITDNSECPDCISIDFDIFKPPQQQTPRYSV